MTIHLYAAERLLFVPNQPNIRIPCAKPVLSHNFFFENSGTRPETIATVVQPGADSLRMEAMVRSVCSIGMVSMVEVAAWQGGARRPSKGHEGDDV